jgi:anti-sigma factor RsiW
MTGVSGIGAGGPHPGDLLSALLDGELGLAEAGAVRSHLDSCPECQRELDYISGARTLVRGLPAVDPPFGFFERMLSPRRSRWAKGAVGMLAAGAAASIAVVALAAPREPSVKPPVANFVDAHVASASTSGDPISELSPAAVPVSFGQ